MSNKIYERHVDWVVAANPEDDNIGVDCPNKECQKRGIVVISHTVNNPERPFFNCKECGLFGWMDQKPPNKGKSNKDKSNTTTNKRNRVENTELIGADSQSFQIKMLKFLIDLRKNANDPQMVVDKIDSMQEMIFDLNK